MRLLPLFLACWCTLGLSAQSVSGTVVDQADVPLLAVNVYWAGTTTGTLTDETGRFELPRVAGERRLVASYVGYGSDTLVVGDAAALLFILRDAAVIREVVVAERRDGAVQSNRTPIKTEQINEVELTKAACCDLAGCFNTQMTVQPQTTNVLTNSKELRILGLSGVYNQTLIDGFPLVQGLAYTYGISSIPGTLVGNIFVAKGANSVLQGFESITGQINVLTRDPAATDRLLLNIYANSFGESQYNANYAFKVGEWKALVSAHAVRPAGRFDRDADTFLDLPLLTRYAGFTKWTRGKSSDWGWSSTHTLRYVDERRVGGQVDFDPDTDRDFARSYGQTVDYQQLEATSRSAYRPDDTHNFILFAAGQYHDQRSAFGRLAYRADQVSTYLNAQYELSYGRHQLSTGLSHRYFRLAERIGLPRDDRRGYAGDYLREESTPGVFAEHTARFFGDKLTWIAGLRLDRHNLYGTQWSPRTLLKYDFSTSTTVRASVGRGWRSVQLFPENLQLLVSARDVRLTEPLDAEAAVNYGINVTQQLETDRFDGYWSVDYYRTDFQNQVFPDYDTDPTLALVGNYRGTSVGNGFQTDLVLRFARGLETKASYNFLDVYREAGTGERTQLPFIARHKLMGGVSYRPASDRYQVDVNAHWYGRQRLPDTRRNPEPFRRPDFSRPYATADVQFTYKWKRFEIYSGVENLFDFRQERPIIGWQNPFGDFFDTSSVWGPTRGRELYLGVRYTVE